MAKTRPAKASEPLDHRAVNLVAKKHYIKDAFVTFAERGTLRKTSETVHRFRVASYSQANATHYVVVLNEAGEELSEDRLGEPDAFDFSGPSPAVLPRPIARTRAITVNPPENDLVLNQEEVHDEVIVVSVPAAAGIPKADVYFLADTTGSMSEILSAVQAGASNILSALNGLGLDLTFGVGNYIDFLFPGDTQSFQHQVSQTNAVAAVTDAINAWVAGGGGDTAEPIFRARPAC